MIKQNEDPATGLQSKPAVKESDGSLRILPHFLELVKDPFVVEISVSTHSLVIFCCEIILRVVPSPEMCIDFMLIVLYRVV